MAIINTLRLRNALVRNGIAADDSAEDLVGVLDDEFATATDNFVTKDTHTASEQRVLTAISDLARRIAERDAEQARAAAEQARAAAEQARAAAEAAADRDRQLHNHITIGIGLIIGAITVATAIISIVIVVLD